MTKGEEFQVESLTQLLELIQHGQYFEVIETLSNIDTDSLESGLRGTLLNLHGIALIQINEPLQALEKFDLAEKQAMKTSY